MTASGRLFFEAFNEGLRIICDDFISTRLVEDASVDLIVTSPPYNVDVHYNSYDDNISYDKYLEFTERWLSKAFRVLRADGRLCLNVPLDKNKGGQQSVYADICSIAKGVGFKYHSTVIWNEGNISRRTAWGSFGSASAPYVIAPVEAILIMYKEQWNKRSRGQSDISKKEFIEWTNGLWVFSGESKRRVGHPTPFPIELPRRCIKLFSYIGDTVLDPFLGSGTTLLACAQLNRKCIGVEIDEKYCRIAEKRLVNEGRIYQQKL